MQTATSLRMPQTATILACCLTILISFSINHVQCNNDQASDKAQEAKPSSLFDDKDTRLALASNEAATDAMLKSIIGGPILNSEFVAELDGAETNAQYGERGYPQLDQAGSLELAALQEQLDARSRTSGQVESNADYPLDGSSAKNPPVYKSAPKQIVDVGHVVDAGPTGAAAPVDRSIGGPSQGGSVSSLGRAERETGADLNREAAGHYKKKSIVHKKKSLKKKKKSKKIKKSKKKVVKIVKIKKKKSVAHKTHKKPAKKPAPPKPHTSLYSGPGHISAPHGDYYDYRSVPAKGAWDFGYKRGNPEHTVQRKEHGDKSHFKTEVKWQDKKGEGHHLWDYNHYNKKHHHHDGHHAAAASKPNVAAARKPTKQPEGPTRFAKEASELVEGAVGQTMQQQQQQSAQQQ